MLKLVVQRRGSYSSAAAEALADCEVVLRDDQERAYGCAWTHEGSHWIAVEGVARFQLVPGSDKVVAYADSAADSSAVETVFYSSVLPIALAALRRYQSLHASAVFIEPLGIVAFAAVSETGKSTIAAGLHARGHPLWADDAVAFEVDLEMPSVTCVSLPFTPRLRTSSAEGGDLQGHHMPIRESVAPRKAAFATLCLLEREN